MSSWIIAVMQRFWIGVPIFFVISGYCITASADAVRGSAKPGIAFFWRRLRRIYPPFWVWTGIAAFLIWSVDSFLVPDFFDEGRGGLTNPAKLDLWQWLGNLTLTETWRRNFCGSLSQLFLEPTWTLCYEEQFYALMLLVLLCGRRFMFPLLLCISLFVIAGFFVFPWIGADCTGLVLDGRWLMFASGILVYYAINYASNRATIALLIPLVTGLILVASNPSDLLLAETNGPYLSYFVAFAFALLLLVMHGWDRRLASVTALKPLRFCGEMCYSLYLVHWPVVKAVGKTLSQLGAQSDWAVILVTVPICLVVAVALARVFHILVERPFMNPPLRTQRASPNT